ncbi:MAG: two-component regulator propeller domain-containing protein [Acidobacteriota bacterium]
MAPSRRQPSPAFRDSPPSRGRSLAPRRSATPRLGGKSLAPRRSATPRLGGRSLAPGLATRPRAAIFSAKGAATHRNGPSWLACLLLLASLFLYGGELAAQPPTLALEHLSLEEGLADETITDLAQDRRGFLWVGTKRGLHRYDGHRLERVAIRPTVDTNQEKPGDESAPREPGEDHITALAPAQDGGLWVATAGHGLCLRRVTGALTCGLAHGRIEALQQHLETLWIATTDAGLAALDLDDFTIRNWFHDPEDPTSVPLGPLTDLAVDDDGTLWLSSFGGGLAQRLSSGEFRIWRHDPEDPASLPDDVVQTLHVDSRGDLWVGTARGGAARHLGEGRFQALRDRSPRAAAEALSLNVQDLVQDLDGTLWMGTFGGGLVRLGSEWLQRLSDSPGHQEVRLDAYRTSPRSPLDPSSVPSDYILHLLRDRSGLLWAGTDAGLTSFGGPRQRFPHYVNDLTQANSLSHNTVWSFAEGHEELWIGTSDGLNHLDRSTGTFSSWAPPRGPQVVLALHQGPDGTLWAGTLSQGLLSFDPSSGEFRTLPGAPGGPPGPQGRPSGRRVEIIRSAPDGQLWLGLQDGGLVRYDPATGRFRQYLHRPDDQQSLAVNTLTDLTFDPQGRLWVATPTGVHRLEDTETGTFRKYLLGEEDEDSLSPQRALDLHLSSDGELWLGTDRGLLRYDPQSDTFRRTAQELDGASVYCSVDDSTGALWLATSRGLARWNPTASAPIQGSQLSWDLDPAETSALHLFSTEAELRSNRLDTGACHRDRQGHLYIGGIFGFHAFEASSIRSNPHRPRVALTELQVLGEPRPASALVDGRPLVLQPDEHSVSFTVSALDFVHPEAHRFAFRLAGYDRDWVESDQRTVRYSTLPPGRYVFEARGTNAHGVWSAEQLAIPVRVLPPLWRSSWAYALYALLAAGLLTFLLVGQSARVRRKSEAQRRQEDLERARSLQLAMLPAAPPQRSDWDIAVHMTTATEVGGDYYDFFTSDEELWVAVGDATGHGISAGMMVSMTKIALRSLPSGAPETILDELGRVLRELHPSGLRMALALAQLESSGAVRLAFAAMPPALIYRAHSGQVEEILRPALPLGGRLPGQHSSATVQLAPQDVLVLFSDGLPERRDSADDPLGYPSVQECFQRHGGDGNAHRVLQALVDLGEGWAQGRAAEDDVTLVVVRRRNSE